MIAVTESPRPDWVMLLPRLIEQAGEPGNGDNEMRKSRIAAIGLLLLAGVSCVGPNSNPNPSPQEFHIPTSRNQWLVVCNEPKVNPPPDHVSFIVDGSYPEALNSHVCDTHGGILAVWDHGLTTVFGLSPHVSIMVANAFEDPTGPGHSRGPIRPAWSDATCHAATCQDSARSPYRVTYLDRREGVDRLACPAIGLLNSPPGARDVRATRLYEAPSDCPIGLTQPRAR